MRLFLYPGLTKNLSKRIKNYFSEISAHYNFDFGSEFEIAICKILRDVLPGKFGICRGFIIDNNKMLAGDDIIIYDRGRFPTLRLLDDGFAQKEVVPFEAVYAYIEVKHNLEIDVPPKKGTLNDALKQLKKVKSLQRESRGLEEIKKGVAMGKHFSIEKKVGWPTTFNPLFTAIISRKISLKNDDETKNLKKGPLTTNKAYDLLHREIPIDSCPDLIVAGSNIVVLPVHDDNENRVIVPFLSTGNTSNIFKTKSISLAIGICQLLRALDFIQLGAMPWEEIIFEDLADQHKKIF